MATHNLGIGERVKIKELLAKLEAPLTMSMFFTKNDLLKEANAQRTEAAKMLRHILET